MERYVVAPEALEDLQDMWDLIARDNVEAARSASGRVFRKLRESCRDAWEGPKARGPYGFARPILSTPVLFDCLSPRSGALADRCCAPWRQSHSDRVKALTLLFGPTPRMRNRIQIPTLLPL